MLPEKSERPVRIVIGDDHALLRDGMKSLLAAEFDVVATASDGQELLDAVLRLQPDVVVADITMPVMNGIDAVKQIKTAVPSTKVVFLSMHAAPIYFRRALEAGGGAYVLKSGANEDLLAAIHAVLGGRVYLSPGLAYGNAAGRLTKSGQAADGCELTERQIEILQLIADGKLSKEIAHALHISVRTVDFHRGRIMARLGVRSVGELVRTAIGQGLITGAAGGRRE